MPQATFRFYAELNDFLPRERQRADFAHAFDGHETVKHLIETLSVPHTEVDLILVNGDSVGFDYQVREGDWVSVYPMFESMDIKAVSQVRPEPLREPRFVLDCHLGKLTTYLRLLGFDTIYRNDFDDHELAEISSSDRRILLTRDRGLLKRSQVTHGYCVRAKNPKQQVKEILGRFDLTGLAKPFSRCARCNGLLKPVPKAEVYDRLEPKTKLYYEEFRICEACDQIYWKGSHFERMEGFINGLTYVRYHS
ncbi:MAG: Mut7-C ubiquitin/RNAse domain-containing protein [Anaerolineales bacterium]|nr:Mut7-C ubiquitin/RNAse domain-containing protein [Chloroflexota bacterium]MBL7161136.1 Mut7-C ubiquitin/RNAse domain-containing protein [Anaerolineales bacterium]